MHYPWWFVPGLTAPMLIAAIAVIHVLVSHYAVGGGILIALENEFALKASDKPYRDYWYKHAQFFVLLTVAFGAITGVGIWWTIGLASPLATEMLIRTFVFGWAIEWVFFIVEIVSAFAMYYYWTKLPPKTHIVVAWIYAIAAWISLVLITGITAFMLDSRGVFAHWSEHGNFWAAFFNVQFLPQTIVRTGGSILLASLYVFLHAAWTLRKPEDAELLQKVVRRMTRPILFGALTMALGVAFWFVMLKPSVLLVMERAVLLNVLLTIFFGLCGLLTLFIVFGPMLNPRSVNVGFAACLFVLGLTALASAEFVREAVRKPWIIDQVVLGNQIYADEIPLRQKDGFLNGIKNTEYRLNDFQPIPTDPIRRGGMIFMYHCNNCHAPDHGMSAVGPLFVGEPKDRIKDFVRRLDEPVYSMPPWCGTEEELDDLAEFILTIRPEMPKH